jgi:hypothetical protein
MPLKLFLTQEQINELYEKHMQACFAVQYLLTFIKSPCICCILLLLNKNVMSCKWESFIAFLYSHVLFIVAFILLPLLSLQYVHCHYLLGLINAKYL